MRYLLTALVAFSLWCAPAHAEPKFPALTGRVVDAANVISSSGEAQLTSDLAAFEQKTGHQLVVVTLPSLQGYEIEEFGYQLGRHWAIGRKDKNDGVLLIIAPNERRVRIEVGYGLEGDLTDTESRLIIEHVILPKFKQGAMETGILDGTKTIIDTLSGKPYEPPVPETDRGAVFIALFFAAFIFFNFTRTVFYLALMPLAFLLRPSRPWLFDSLEGGRKSVFARLRKIPILPLLITFPIWMILPIFFSANWKSGGGGGGGGFSGGRGGGGFSSGGGGGGGFSGGGGSFGGGGGSGRW